MSAGDRTIRRAAAVLGFGMALMLLPGCEKKGEIAEAFPQTLAADAACSVDGMLLMSHPGPKGQIALKDGKTLYFCDTKELFLALHDADIAHRIVGAFTQPMDEGDFAARADGWAPVNELVYVLDSARQGAMGRTIVPFRAVRAAESFVAERGGRVVQAEALTADMVAEYARSARKDMGAGGHEGMMEMDKTNEHDDR